ncbi:MAG: hypothetical protein ACI4R9_03505 [Kiritimatiellia bacterium]
MYDEADALVEGGKFRKALRLYERLSEQGSAVAAARLGLYYTTGEIDGIRVNGPAKDRQRVVDYDKARWFSRLAFRRGDLEGASLMAWLIYREFYRDRVSDVTKVAGSRKKAREMRRWIKLAFRGERGKNRGQLYYLLGWNSFWFGGDMGERKAIGYWRKGARLEEEKSLEELGIAYGFGENARRDLRRSLSYFRRALASDPGNRKRIIRFVGQICSPRWNGEDELRRAGFLDFLQELRGK